MEKDFKSLADFYHEKKIEGMDFSQIRRELADQNIEEGMIKNIVREIDNRILNGDVKKGGKLKAKQLRLIGWILMIIGGVITIGAYLQWIDVKGFQIITYGPVIAGYLLIIAARKAERKAL